MEGKDIKKLRNVVSLSQEYFARSLGVSSREVARWEKEENEPSAEAYQKLLKWKVLVQNLESVEYDPAGWFNMKSRALAGRSPRLVVAMGPEGLQIVFDLVGRMAHGVTS